MSTNSEEELREHIRQFLREFKSLMWQGDFQVFTNHLKNRETLVRLGLTYKNREEEILGISVENYSSGPNKDTLHDGYFWVFGKMLGKLEIYIKLKIVEYGNGNESAVCYSFHISEAPLKYPFRQ